MIINFTAETDGLRNVVREAVHLGKMKFAVNVCFVAVQVAFVWAIYAKSDHQSIIGPVIWGGIAVIAGLLFKKDANAAEKDLQKALDRIDEEARYKKIKMPSIGV